MYSPRIPNETYCKNGVENPNEWVNCHEGQSRNATEHDRKPKRALDEANSIPAKEKYNHMEVRRNNTHTSDRRT